jgi:nucleotide-binding universal stress UspA family protein
MMSFERILLPTDGSTVSEPAESRAIELADEADAVLEVVHVIEAPAIPLGDHREPLLENLEDEANAFVESVARRASEAGVTDVNKTVAHGKPHEAILDTAEERDCDLIVVGTHGRAEHQPYVLGSVTARLLQHSPVKVLVVPTHDGRK